MAILSPFSVFAKEKLLIPLAQQALDILKEFDGILGVIWNMNPFKWLQNQISKKKEELRAKKRG